MLDMIWSKPYANIPKGRVQLEVLVSVRRDPETIEQLGRLMKQAMVETLDMSQYVVHNKRLKWEWPPYLDMDIDLKAGDNYGAMASFGKYVKALRDENMENLEIIPEDPDAEDPVED